MKVALVYAGTKKIKLNCNVEEQNTVAEIIESSGILKMCPEIDLKSQKVGVYGKFIKLDNTLKDGDRIEIYRKITRVIDDDDDDDDDDD